MPDDLTDDELAMVTAGAPWFLVRDTTPDTPPEHP